MTESDTIYHVTTRELLGAADPAKNYSCPSLQEEGFIHCCFEPQITGVLQRYYEGVPELLLLVIASEKLSSLLRHENTVGGTELFPHVYGAINLDSVTEVLEVDQTAYRD